jgi:asparagine synthase (glutamine-hydrolysing)
VGTWTLARRAGSVAHKLPTLYDEPFADSSAIPMTLLSRLTRDHVIVALSGDGGDEIFGGYEHYAKLRHLLSLFGLPRAVRHLLANIAPLVPRRSLRNGLAHLTAGDHLELVERLYSYFGTAELRMGCGEEGARPSDVFADTFAAAPTDDPIARVRFGDCRTYLCDDILTKVDRASMSMALEVRVPILDHRVVQFGMGLPSSIVWHGGETKAPLRAVLYRRVPRELIERPKHGFGIPIETLLARELEEWPKRYLESARLAEEGLFLPDGVAPLLARARAREPAAFHRLWLLLCFPRWFAWNHRGERDA